LIGAGTCVVLLLIGIFAEPGRGHFFHFLPAQFLRSWLFAWIFWFGISLGCVGIVMMHYLTGGNWGYLIRRFALTAGLCIPLMAVLFVPIIIGARYIYPWADSYQLAHDPVLRHKAPLLNWPFWTVRAVVILLIFSAMAWLLQSLSNSLDRQSGHGRTRKRLINLSAGGQVVYFLLMSLASVDWIMSREPHWYSTVFGFVVITSQALSAMCFLILMVGLFSREQPFNGVVRPDYLNDLGTVLIMFVVFWAYLSFAQFLVTWLGNSQNEITWYIRRTDGFWRWIGGALILFHFLVPFILLLLRPMKRKMGRLAAVAGGLLFMRVIDVLYWVTPADPHDSYWGAWHWIYAEVMNLLALLAIGGIWFATFLWLLRDKPILPVDDALSEMAIEHGNAKRPAAGAL
jgi:hypothetical protein